MDWSTLDFSGIFTEFMKVVPIAAAVIIPFIGFRKSWGFVKGQIKGA